jgi:hypothetical protein
MTERFPIRFAAIKMSQSELKDLRARFDKYRPPVCGTSAGFRQRRHPAASLTTNSFT